MPTEKKELTIMGISLPLYFCIGAILVLAVVFGTLPNNIIGALAIMIYFGALFNLIGNHTPIINKYLGGGPIVVIFGSAAVAYFFSGVAQITALNTTISTFMKGGGFLDFYIAALITGSILGMNRELLLKATVRYLPALLGGIVVAVGFAGLAGYLVGFRFAETTAYVSIPIMGGGMGAGAVPLSEVFAKVLALDPGEVLSRMVPAVALGNAASIVFAGLLDRLGKIYPKLSGNGSLVRSKDNAFDAVEKEDKGTIQLADFGVGIVLACAFFTLGTIISKIIPAIHTYAWMILTVAVVKALNLMPQKYQRAVTKWYEFVATNFTSALLIGIGVAYTDLGQIIETFSIKYLIVVIFTVIGAIIGAGAVGHLVGFYFVESAITAGLCMANMGGTGDVAVLSSANRMELMPFAQISSRIGGALILLLATILLPFLF